MTLAKILESYGACDEATEWADSKKMEKAWKECPRGDWLLWIAAKAGADRKIVVMAACAVARTALRFVPKGEDRPRKCIEVTEAWCRGEATLNQVIAARREARTAAATAAAYAAAYAAYAAYDAANAAAYAANAAAYAAYDAYAAANAAAYAANDAANAAADTNAARRLALKRSATAVRKVIPFAAVLAAHKKNQKERVA